MLIVLGVIAFTVYSTYLTSKQSFVTPHMYVGDCSTNPDVMDVDPVSMYYEGILGSVGAGSPLPNPHDDDTDCTNYWWAAYEAASDPTVL